MSDRFRWKYTLDWLFLWAWSRHLNNDHNADYEVCDSPVCRVCWFIENWLWYGGKGVA